MAAGMEQMDTGCLRLQSEPKALYIREAEIREAAGEHGVMNIRFIPAKVPEEPDILRGQGSMVRLTTADGETVFCGKCENLHLSCENQYAEMELTARTLSVLKDQGQKTASYQGTDKMLSEVFAAGIGEDALFQLDKDEKVPEMLLQDRETDWEFGRRLAYRKKRLLFVNSKASGCQIHAGAVPFAKKEAGKVLVRRVRRDVDRVRGIQGNTVPGTSVFEHEETILVVCDLTIGAGYSVCFDGRDMIVVKSHITCEQGLLQNEITLVNKEGLLPSAGQTMEAARQTGILRGKVLAVDGTNVQVDFGTPGDQPRWIPYANTVSNYFYCMPDTGDMVEVYYEMDAGERVVCLGSRHAGDNPDFGRYQDKMLTAQNRMVKFGEKALHLIGNRSEFDGKGGEQAKIILNSEQGVEVQSTKDIQLKTEGGNITFQSAPRSYAGTDGVRMASAAMHQVGNVMHMAMAGIGPVFNMAGYVDPGFWTKLRKEVADHAPQSGGDGKVNLMGMKKVILQTGSSSAAFVKGKIHIKADIFQQLGINRSMSFGPVKNVEASVEDMGEKGKNGKAEKEPAVDPGKLLADLAGALPSSPSMDPRAFLKTGIRVPEGSFCRPAAAAGAAAVSMLPTGAAAEPPALQMPSGTMPGMAKSLLPMGTGAGEEIEKRIFDMLREVAKKKVREILQEQSRRAAGPVLSVIYDTATGMIAFGQNFKTTACEFARYKEWEKNGMDPLLQESLAEYQKKIDEQEIKLPEYVDHRRAAHSEIVALDAILKNRREQGLPVDRSAFSDLYLYNMNLTEAYSKGDFVPKDRCPNCSYLTTGINVSDHK